MKVQFVQFIGGPMDGEFEDYGEREVREGQFFKVTFYRTTCGDLSNPIRMDSYDAIYQIQEGVLIYQHTEGNSWKDA